MKKNNFLIIDPCLTNFQGHYFNYDKCIIDVLNLSEHYKPTLFCNKSATNEIELLLKPIKHFSNDIFAESSIQAVGPQKTEINFLQINELFYKEFCYINNYLNISRFDIIFFPNITQNQLLAIYKWVLSLPIRPQIIITLRYLNSHMLYNSSRGMTDSILDCYKKSFDSLNKIKEIHFISDTDQLSEFYSSIAGIAVHTLPIPFNTNANQPATFTPRKKLRISQLGTWSIYKGSDLIIRSIRNILLKYPQVEFFLQTGLNLSSEEREVLSSLCTEFNGRIIVAQEALNDHEYFENLLLTDILLLCYLPEHYQYQSSGVLVEAGANGIVFISSKNTFMHYQSLKFDLGSTILSEYNVDSLISSIEYVIENYSKLHTAAQNSKFKFISYHNPLNFINELFQIVSKGGFKFEAQRF